MSDTTVTIKVIYSDVNAAEKAAEQLKRTLDGIGHSIYNVNLFTPQQKQQYSDMQKDMQKLAEEAERLKRGLDIAPNNRDLQKQYVEVTEKIKDATKKQREFVESIADAHIEFEKFNEELEHTQSILNGIGTAFKALGTISGWTATFANSVGDAFSNMGSLFKTDLSGYIASTLTETIVNQLIGETSKVVGRYDILNTFSQYMGIMGIDKRTADSALSAINTSILGLPIGLDEAAQRFRRYLMYMNDVQSAQNLTIGLQNLLVAGGAGESYQTQAYTLIERMLATGTLRDVRQWQSLLVGLGVSQRFIEEELGLSQGSLMSQIRSGTIDVQSFLNAIEALGAGTSKAAGDVSKALDIYRSTIQSWLSNIEYAVTRGNVAVLNAFNDTLQAVSGKGITDYLSTWRETENNVFGWTADYIRNNPDQLKRILDSVEKLLEAFSSLSASEFIQSVIANFEKLSGIVGTLFAEVPDGWLEDFSAFAITVAGPIGKIFKAVSSGAPYMIAVFERFENFDWDMFAKDLADAVKSLASIFETLLSIASDPVLSKLLAYGLVYGGVGQAVFGGIGSGIQKGAGLYTQYQILKYLGVAPNLLPYLGIAGAGTGVVTAAGIVAGIHDNKYWDNFYSEIEGLDDKGIVARYEEERSKYNNAILAVERSNGRDATATREAQGARERMEILEPMVKAIRSEITQSITGNASRFEWLESAGKYNEIAVAVDNVTESVNKLADSYWTAKKAAEESTESQVQVWGNAEETIEGITNRIVADTESKMAYMTAVNELMNFLTPENASLINDLIESGVDNLDQIVYVLGELKKKKDVLDPLIDGLEESEMAADSLDAVLSYLSKHLDELASGAKTKGQVYGEMLAEGLDAGAGDAARAAWRFAYGVQIALNSIRIPDYFSHFNDTNDEYTWEQPGKFASSGGLIYASNGRFIPRGTDTVPAMLTPGEFVMRRAAVDAFGAKFMKYVNDLNIGAAFDSLVMSRERLLHGSNVTYNNSRDNHATVNQNIVTNSPGFTYKRAGRFVRGLA